MSRTRKILIALIVVALGVFGFMSLAYPTVTINYRLTLEAVTPDGPKMGSGVIQVSYGSELNFNGGGRKGRIEVTGEAVHVDLGGGKILFVTLTDKGSGRQGRPGKLDGALDAGWLPVLVYNLKLDWGKQWKLVPQIEAAKAAGRKDVPLGNLPTLVTFNDIENSKSVALVEPERLSAVFGSGYALTGAKMEITDAPITNGIESILKWLNRLQDYQTDPENPFTNTSQINRRHFIQGGPRR